MDSNNRYLHTVSRTCLLEDDGPNNTVMTRLTCKDTPIDYDRGHICSSGNCNSAYVNQVLDACVKVLSAKKADMETGSQPFVAAVTALNEFCSRNAPLEITDLPLLNAYVEISLLHAFTRGTGEICTEAAEGLKSAGTMFTAGVLIALKERYEGALKATRQKKLDRDAISAEDRLAKRCALVFDVFTSVKERFADCGLMTFRLQNNKLITALQPFCRRSRATV